MCSGYHQEESNSHCTLVNSHVLSSTLVYYHQLSCTVLHQLSCMYFDQFSCTIINFRQLSCTIVNSHVLSSTHVLILNSLIIHKIKTKEINTETEFGYVMKHLHKIKPTFISIFSLNTDLFEMLYQT